jgi:hypothetical protein
MVVTLAQLMDMHPGIRLHLTDHIDESWYCDEAAPSVWFATPFLWEATRAVTRYHMPPWTMTPGYIRLHAANGTWIWRLTNQYRDGTNLDGQLRYRLGIWPD